jgi:ribosome-associated protein
VNRKPHVEGTKLVAHPRVAVPLDEFRWSYARSGGPGGQNVNKVNSKATLRWSIFESPSLPDDVRSRFLASYRRRVNDAGEVVVVSQRFRDAPRNADDCLAKLGAMLAAVAPTPKARRPSKPTRGSIRRRLENKRIQSDKKSSRGGAAAE